MPTRSSPNSLHHSHLVKYRKLDGSTGVFVDSQSTEKWVDSVTFGDNLSDWRGRLVRGESATTGMSGNRITYRYTPGYGKFVRQQPHHPALSNTVEAVGDMVILMAVPLSNPGTIDTGRSDSEALGKFNSRIRDRLTAFQGGVFLGELGQTIQTIKNPARGLRRLADSSHSVLKRIRIDGLRGVSSRNIGSALNRVTANLADAWLELQFGWKPLLHDIDDGSKALAILNTGQSLSTGRISASAEVESNPTVTISTESNELAAWRVQTVTKDRCLVVYRGALRADAMNPAEMEARLLGFDPSSFLPTAWELLPWSFLVDYFTNIGQIIEGWSQLGINLAWCNRTVRSSKVIESSSFSSLLIAKQITGLNYSTVAFAPSKSVIESTSVLRAEFNGVRNPGLVFKLPGSGSLKWLNIAALIASRGDDRKWSYGN